MASSPETWKTPPVLPAIRGNEVHLWRADLEATSGVKEQLAQSLGEEELSRARRFRFAVHRDRFIVRRGMLRWVLARYLDCEPATLQLERSEFGKPFLGARHGSDLRFSNSHSENLALLAIARGRDVGVDLERIKPGFSDLAIPEQFFTPREAAMLRALPAGQQPEAFFDLWVRKEAYVKARGMGLSLALDSFEVPLGDAEPVRLLRAAPDSGEAGIWTVVALRPAREYPAALVVQGEACPLRCWNWSCTPGGDGHRPAGNEER
jgi:4'-phosphopantetheinyl transferase